MLKKKLAETLKMRPCKHPDMHDFESKVITSPIPSNA